LKDISQYSNPNSTPSYGLRTKHWLPAVWGCQWVIALVSKQLKISHLVSKLFEIM